MVGGLLFRLFSLYKHHSNAADCVIFVIFYMKKAVQTIEPEQKGPIIELADLGCASALIASGFELLEIKKYDGKRAIFVFATSKNALDAVNAYWDNRLQIRARTMFDTVKALKSRIFTVQP